VLERVIVRVIKEGIDIVLALTKIIGRKFSGCREVCMFNPCQENVLICPRIPLQVTDLCD